MNLPRVVPQPQAEGLMQLVVLRRQIEAAFEQINGGRAPAHAQDIEQLLFTLELRNKLEEQLLFPALHDAGVHDSDADAAQDNELQVLRHLADHIRAAPPGDAQCRQSALMALEGVAMLHFATVERLLVRHAARLDRAELTRDVRNMMARWQQEVLLTGDIEDEENDPVGLPPR